MFIVDTALSTVYRRNNHVHYTCQFRLILGDSIGMFRAISTRRKVKGGGGGVSGACYGPSLFRFCILDASGRF